MEEIAEIYEREVRDLPCFEYRTTVVIELYRVRCPECGPKAEKVAQLPSKAPFSKRFEEAVGKPARVRQRAGSPNSLVWPRALSAALTCGIWSGGRRRGANQSCARWAWMRSTSARREYT